MKTTSSLSLPLSVSELKKFPTVFVNDFAWIKEVVRIKCRFDCPHGRERPFACLAAQEVALA